MTTVAWFHCFAGIAGDMALGACLDAGAPLDEVTAILERLPVAGWALEAELVMRGGLAATKAHVRAKPDGITRTYGHIAGIIEEARLPDRVRERSQRVFRLLAETEGRLHRRPTAAVHFHEVGGIDAIVDIVGTCAALETLGVDEVTASPVRVGTGMVRTAHGLLPNPPPAVVDLLKDAPVVGLDVNVELTTPTGAALLAGLSSGYGPMPAMRLAGSGFGAGTRDLPTLPNLVQVAVGEAYGAVAAGGAGGAIGAGALAGEPLALLEANLDDVGGEVVAHAVDALLAAGALDAWTAHVTMKKGRPGVVLTAVARPEEETAVAEAMLRHTTTLGVRLLPVLRWELDREQHTVAVAGQPVSVKVGRLAGEVVNLAPEHEDVAHAAAALGRPAKAVWAEAWAAAQRDLG